MKYKVEFIGTFFLVAVVIGSGIMAEKISDGNMGIALLGNTIPTGAILYVIIKMFTPISGAHYLHRALCMWCSWKTCFKVL